MEVPWRRKEEIECEAEIVVDEYGKKIKPIEGPPVPVENIIEGFFELQLEIDDLNGGNLKRDVLGCVHIKEKRVVIEKELQNQEGRYNYTCAHEVGHWVLHKDIYLESKRQTALLETPETPSIICRESQKKRDEEWQADNFAAALLMPKKLVLSVLEKEGHRNPPHIYTLEDLKFWTMTKEGYRRMVASRYNKLFGVSVQAMQIRLEEFGFLRQEVNRVLF